MHHRLCTLPKSTPLARLTYLTKPSWRLKRDYKETKSEVGLDHFEGRTRNGLHHHLALFSIVLGFLVQKRAHDQRPPPNTAHGWPKAREPPSKKIDAHG